MFTIKELQVVHPGVTEYASRWDYYMRSYLGAEEYREGAYLRKYYGEDEAPGNAIMEQRSHAPTVDDPALIYEGDHKISDKA